MPAADLAGEKTALQNIDRDVNARMPWAAHEISVVIVVDVNLIGVAPSRRQRTGNHEPVAAIVETGTARNDDRSDDYKAVLVAKMPVPIVVIDAAVMPLIGFMALMAFPGLVPLMVFMFALARFLALPSLMASPVFVLALSMPSVVLVLPSFMPSAVVMAIASITTPVTLIFVSLVLVAIMIVLGERRHRYADGQSQDRSKTVSNQSHQITSPLARGLQSAALSRRLALPSPAPWDMYSRNNPNSFLLLHLAGPRPMSWRRIIVPPVSLLKNV